MTQRHVRLLASTLAALGGLAASALAGDASSAAHSRLLAAQPGARLHMSGDVVGSVYGGPLSNGASPRDSAVKFAEAFAGLFGAEAADLTAGGLNADGAHLLPVSFDAKANAYRFTLVSYTQARNGVPVWQSDLRLLVRNEPGFPVVLAKSALKDLGAFQVAGPMAKAIDAAVANEAARGVFPLLNQFDPARLVIFAGTPDVPAAPLLAWEFIAHGPAGADGVPQKWLFLVDAVAGAVLYRENLVMHANVTGTVQGMATTTSRAAACDPEALTPMPYARVQISGGNFAYADADGNFDIPHGGTAPVTVTSSPRGQFFRVFHQGATTTTLSQTVTPPGPVSFIHNEANDHEFTQAEVNAYVHANIVRDYTLAFNPAFPAVASSNEFTVNVNLDSTCNAFYNGNSINFYVAGGGCNNTAFSTVVHHEYGHHIVQSAGSGQGAYGEGFGDVMGVLITDESSLGRGFQSCASGIRNANNNCQYSAANCSSCGSAIHSCGQLLSGCVWSTRTSLLASHPSEYRQIISDLAINSVLLHQGSSINDSIVIDFLVLDDDDDTILNGTPHYSQIAQGFGAHGLNAPVLPPLGFVFPDGRPELASPAGGTGVLVQVIPLTATPMPGTGMLVYDTGSGWQTAPMTQLEPNLYQAEFPASACGTLIRYHFSASTTTSQIVTGPLDAPASFYTTVAATGIDTVFADAFESNQGWTVGAPGDTATLGIWVRVNPNGAYVGGVPSQSEDDVTPDPGVMCFVTGNAPPGATAGAEDVDGGATSLLSPTFDLSGATQPRIGYWRWYSNHLGAAPYADIFVIQISSDNGANWTTVETVGPTGPQVEGGWLYHEFSVTDFIVPTATMRMKFVASDFGSGSLVEAGLDEFDIKTFVCETFCPGDFNQDQTVGVDDIFAFLAAWFALSPAADVDGVPGVTVPDIFFFLSLWFTPCP